MRSLTMLLTLLTAAGCGGGSHRAFSFGGHAANCPRPGSYVPALSRTRGVAGSRVVITGTIPLYNEAGKLDLSHPTRRMDVWWNLDARHWWSALTASPESAAGGAATRVLRATVPDPSPCTYRLTVEIPQAAPGRYPITVLYSGQGSSAILRPVVFTLTG